MARSEVKYVKTYDTLPKKKPQEQIIQEERF